MNVFFLSSSKKESHVKKAESVNSKVKETKENRWDRTVNNPSQTPSKLPGLKASEREFPRTIPRSPTVRFLYHSPSHSLLDLDCTQLETVGARGLM